ncbi:protein unc-13 homolog [Impatiens glandulifera]|uniref:protein unc-13 homolog n=1 Tax=Impatiens glandulifera TaxID=253017 RepID=UPI001FB16D17|nr:protein unc-13 homolog [Impatiens glandulifera]
MVIMGPLARRETGSLIHHHPTTTTAATISDQLSCPFGILHGIDADDLRQTAYEIFFASCRSSHGFGARKHSASSFDAADVHVTRGGGWVSPGSPMKPNINNHVTNSKVKRSLGLRMLKQCKSRRSNSLGGDSLSPCSSPKTPRGGKAAFNTSSSSSLSQPLSIGRRKMTLAEIMRQQMKVTEQDDSRLRKTLVRTLVSGQTAKRPETIILPLELLRHLKPSEFAEPNDYHKWQQRQFRFLESGLLRHPSIPLDSNSTAAVRLRDLVRSIDHRPLDTSARNSESMRTLCNSVISLSWRSTADNSSPASDSCHWADGYPLNIHIYVTLLRSIFDLQEETAVIDEVDEIFELMKKTWTTLAINRSIHNLCFTWVLFERFVEAGGGAGSEAELLRATLVMLNEVMGDSKRAATSTTPIDSVYLRMLGPVMVEMKNWSEKKLEDYHKYYHTGTGVMENLLLIVFAVTKTSENDDVPVSNIVDKFIRSSLRNAFSQVCIFHIMYSLSFLI